MKTSTIIIALVLCVLACAQANKKPLKPQRPDCLQLKCDNPSKKLLCVSSKKNDCQLLTICQVSRVNCQRGPLNALRKVESELCKGMKAGQKLKKCIVEKHLL